MQGLINLFRFIGNNWPILIILAGIIIVAVNKIVDFMKSSNEEKIATILALVAQVMKEKVAKAEIDWSDYKKTGQIKKSQVISEIYDQFPELATLISSDELEEKLSELIDDALIEINKTITDSNKTN
jgi:DNA-binding transcriptional regulator YdaS (Cro superfamily)